MRTDFNIPVINILWQLIAGYRFTNSKEHEHGRKIVEGVTESLSTGMKTSIFPMWILKVYFSFENANTESSEIEVI